MKRCRDCRSRRDVRTYRSGRWASAWAAPLCGEHRGRMNAWRAVCEEQSCLPSQAQATTTFRGVSIPLLEDSGLSRTLELTVAIFGDAETYELRHMAHLALQHDEDTERERPARSSVEKRAERVRPSPEECSRWCSANDTGIVLRCDCWQHVGLPTRLCGGRNQLDPMVGQGVVLRPDGTWSHGCRRAIIELALPYYPEGFRRAERADPYWATHDGSASAERSSASAGLAIA